MGKPLQFLVPTTPAVRIIPMPPAAECSAEPSPHGGWSTGDGPMCAIPSVIPSHWQEAHLHDMKSVEWLIERLESADCTYWWLTVLGESEFALKWQW